MARSTLRATTGQPDAGDHVGRRGVLQDVAGGARLDRRHDVLLVAEDGDDHDVDVGLLLADLADQVDAAAVGQAKVDQHHVERFPVDDGLRLALVGADPDELHARFVLDDLHEAPPEFRFILDDDDRDRLVAHSHTPVLHIAE
jgi:hypothetical protein